MWGSQNPASLYHEQLGRIGCSRGTQGGELNRSQSKQRRHVTSLDGLRALSIIAVLVFHARASWLPGGFLGVTVFFVLSGYLITESLLHQIEVTGTIDLKRYLLRRLERLYPVMIVVVVVTAILTALFAPVLLAKMRGDVVPSLLFFNNLFYIVRDLPYFAAAGAPSPLTHFWFLGVLVQFYVIWPFALLLITRISPSHRFAQNVVGVLAMLSTVLTAVLFDPAGDTTRVYYGPDTRMGELLIGAFLAFLWPMNALDDPRSRRPGPPPLLFEIVGTVSLIALVILMFELNGYSAFLYRGGFLLTSILSATLIACIVVPDCRLGIILGGTPLRLVGERSYSLYLWHYPLLLIMNPVTRTSGTPWWLWVIEFIIIGAVTGLSYHFVEQGWKRYLALIVGSGIREDTRFADPRSRRMSVNRKRRYNIPLIATSSIVLVSVALLIAGPFWYHTDEEEAAIRAAQGQQSDAASQGGSGQVAAEGISASGEDPSGSTTVAEQMNGVFYQVDANGVTDAPVLFIGDSVPGDATDQFDQMFPNGHIDAKVSRQLTEGVERYNADVAAGYPHDVVVLHLGTNGPVHEGDLRNLLDTIGPDTPIYLLNIRTPDPLQDMNNDLYGKVDADYPNVTVVDWFSYSANHDGYFWDDGTHLRPEGAVAYMEMVREAVTGA